MNLGQEFVVGGYLPSDLGIDSLIVGYYKDDKLYYAGRVRAGLVRASRRQIARELQGFITKECPFFNLPERGPGQWGEGLTKEKMTKVIWLRPVAVAHIDFLEWTSANRLRHTTFVAMRYDKDSFKVIRET
jgi:bifunctional non-homologous end joining protein LigD